jgi:hypothetical protein
MSKESTITPQAIEATRSRLESSLKDPLNGKFIRKVLDDQIQLMIGWRVQKSLGYHRYPDDPDSSIEKNLVYDQRACQLFQGRIIKGNTIWETHEDIQARGEIPSTAFRVSGDVFYVRNLPHVPIVRCDSTPKQSEIDIYKKQCVLLNYDYTVL